MCVTTGRPTSSCRSNCSSSARWRPSIPTPGRWRSGCWIGQTPRSLRDWKPATPGASGAITLAGTLAALAGASAIPLFGRLALAADPLEVFLITWAGFLGSLIDSLLGASLQVQYRDPTSGELTERAEVGGRAARRVRGLPWMNNDVVNFLAGAGGVLCGWILMHYGLVFL